MTDTDMLYMASLEKRNAELEARVAELEEKHFVECTIISQCATEHRQLAEWLTDYKELKNSIGAVKFSNMKEALELIREYKAENIAQKKLIAEYKRLLKAAVEDMYNSVNDVHCKYCSKWHTDQCQGTSHLDCYLENKFKWRHADEALALIGGETND